MNVQSVDQATIEEINNRLVKAYNPHEIYLLGPYQENKLQENKPNLSILVVVDGVDIEHYDLMTKGHEALTDVKLPKSILVYTPEEFAEYSQDSSTLSYLIKKYGKRIYAHA